MPPLTHEQIDAAVADAKAKTSELEAKLQPGAVDDTAELETALQEVVAEIDHLADLARQGAATSTSTTPAASAAAPAAPVEEEAPEQKAAPAQSEEELKATAAEGSPVAEGQPHAAPAPAAGGDAGTA